MVPSLFWNIGTSQLITADEISLGNDKEMRHKDTYATIRIIGSRCCEEEAQGLSRTGRTTTKRVFEGVPRIESYYM